MKSPLELMFLDALSKANASRRAVGLPPAEAAVRKLRDGTKAVGPPSYLVSLHLRPWHYADIVHAMERYQAKHGKKLSLHKLFEGLVEDYVPHVAARPPKTQPKKKDSPVAAALPAKPRPAAAVVPIKRRSVYAPTMSRQNRRAVG